MRRTVSSPVLFLPLLAVWNQIALAAGDPARELCFSGCQMSLRPPHFNDTGSDNSKLGQACLSRFGILSLYLCLEVHCEGDHQTGGLAHLNRSCTQYLQSPLPPFDVIANYTDDVISELRHLRREEAVYETVLGEVVVPTKKLFKLSYDTLDTIIYVEKYHFLYGAAMFVFWTLVVVIGMCSRIMSAIRDIPRGEYRPLLGGDQLESDEISAYKGVSDAGRRWLWLKRHLTVPAAFGYRCAQNVGWCTIPPRIQSLTILVFVIINIFFCVHGYRVFPGNMYWPEVSPQVWRYLSDRTGIISFANFPIIWLFGMRNNLLMWLTGWDFGTFNNFHRWIARVATVQAVVHSVGYTVLVFNDGGWPYFVGYWSQLFWWTGELATIFMCLLLGLSVFWMRRNSYETFLILHIVLSILILVMMLGHVSIFKGRFDGFIWSSALVWGFDRLLRLSRVLSFNPRFWSTRAKATYDPNSNIIRLTVPYSTSAYQPKPGTYYYIHVLNDARFWESHPFTVASTTARHSPNADQTSRRDSIPADEVSLLLQGEPGPASSTAALGPHRPQNPPPPATMTFLLRPYDGFTRRLRDTAAAAAGHHSSSPSRPPPAASLRVLVDGPYGHTQRFDRFDVILFVVGGSGIVVPLSHLASLSSSSRSVRVVWAAREEQFAAEVLREDFGGAGVLDGGWLALDVYITGGSGYGHGHGRPPAWPEAVTVLHGRPDVCAEVECAARTVGAGSLAVVACGPARMADDARRAVVDMLGRGSNIEYFEESFRW